MNRKGKLLRTSFLKLTQEIDDTQEFEKSSSVIKTARLKTEKEHIAEGRMSCQEEKGGSDKKQLMTGKKVKNTATNRAFL